MAALPDVRPALTAAGFPDAGLKGIRLTDRVADNGVVDAEQLAEVIEVSLGRGALGLRHVLRGGDELLRSHGTDSPRRQVTTPLRENGACIGGAAPTRCR